jgi:Co/Zn/Cd efflux system component
MAAESSGTVRLALAANVVVALVKCACGLITGSAAMTAEAAHSCAATLNELLLSPPCAAVIGPAVTQVFLDATRSSERIARVGQETP